MSANRVNGIQNWSSFSHHQVDPGFFAVLPKATHCIGTACYSHEEPSKACIDNYFVVFFFKFKDNSIHDIVVLVFLGRLADVLLRVDVLHVIAVADFDQERISQRHWIDLSIDIEFDLALVLLVWVGNEMDSRHVSERGFVIRVDFVYFESIFEELSFSHSWINLSKPQFNKFDNNYILACWTAKTSTSLTPTSKKTYI